MSESQLLRSWGESSEAGRFHGLAKEIKESTIISSVKLDSSLTRLLVIICNYVTTHEKLSPSTASDLEAVIRAIHSKLSTLPNPDKYFSSLYHVIRIFLNLKYHQNAREVTDYFLPNSLWCSTVQDVSYFLKLAALWASSLTSYLKSTKFNDTEFQNANQLIQYQLKLRLLSNKDDHRLFINDLNTYYYIIKSFEDETHESKFQSFIIETLTNTKISLGMEDKYRSYESILRLITDILNHHINLKGINRITSKFRRLFEPFHEAVKVDKEIDRCFRIYEFMCSIFLRPVSAFDTATVDASSTYIQKIDFLTKEYGADNAMRRNSKQGSVLLQYVLIYWDNYAKTKGKFDIPQESILKLLSSITHEADVLSRQAISSCDKCSSKKCTVKRDIYGSIGIKTRVLLVLSRMDTASDSLRQIAFSLFQNCIKNTTELKDNNCETWLRNWSLCCSRVFNIINSYDISYYHDYFPFSELLCTKIISFGVEELFDKENFLALCLHRLGSAHFHKENYQESMEVAALSAYVGLSTGEGSSFRTWANCKYRYPSAKSISMVECLESNKVAAKFGITVKLNDCQKRQIYLQEIKGLQNCQMNMVSSILEVVKEFQSLNPDPIEYAQVIHLLGYHLLDTQNSESIKELLTKAQLDLKKCQKSPTRQLLYGNLSFYSFIQKLSDIRSATEAEMRTSTMRLSVKSRSDPGSNVVPAYSLINIVTSSSLETSLQRVLDYWSKYCEQEGLIESFGKFLTPTMMTRLIIIAAEYAKFYHFRNVEITAWKLAMNLASKFNNYKSIIYICSRSIMSRYLNTEWITLAEESVNKLKDSSEEEIIEGIAMFKFSLSSHYFFLGKINEAKKLFDEALDTPGMQFTKNYPTYLFAMDLLVSNRLEYKDESDKLKYVQTIIKGLYTVILIEESVTHSLPREDMLYRLDMTMQFTNHITLRVNSLVAHREISAHLIRRLSVVQKLGSTLHVAECLKNLCFLDLSRNQLEDCEVKVQGLEHILRLDSFDLGVRTNNSKSSINLFCDNSPLRPIESVRDIPHNDASPVLITKVFFSPEFMAHDDNCKCFKCTNFTYKYLVFSCTHIRAQLYAAQNNVNQAVEHFYGALQIIKKLIDVEVESFEIVAHKYVEYVLFLLDFAKFIKYSIPDGSKDALDMIIYALSICKRHKIENHPVYFSAREIIFEYRFQETFGPEQYKKFMVPEAKKEVESDQMIVDEDICTTPVRGEARIVKIKRRHTPPILDLNKAIINVEQEDDDCLTPVVACDNEIKIVKKPPRVTKIKPIRRKISDSEYLTPLANKDHNLSSKVSELPSKSKEIEPESKKPPKTLVIPKIKIQSIEKINLNIDHLRQTKAKSGVSSVGDVKTVKDNENKLNDINCNVKKSSTKVDNNSTGKVKSSTSKATKESKIKIKDEDIMDLEALHISDSSSARKTRSRSTAQTNSSSKTVTMSQNELDNVVNSLEAVHISENVCKTRGISSDSDAKERSKPMRISNKTTSASRSTGSSKVNEKDSDSEIEVIETPASRTRRVNLKNLEPDDEVIENSIMEEPRRSRRVANKKSEPDKDKFKVLKSRN